MDGERFDAIIKGLTSSATRRRVLRRFFSGSLGGLLTVAGVAGATARKKCKGADKSCQSNEQCCSKICDKTFTCVCAPGDQQCDRDCFSLFDANNCGACGVQCVLDNVGEVCQIHPYDPPGSPPRCCKILSAPCTPPPPSDPISLECCSGICNAFRGRCD